jgi:protein ImuB
MIALRLDAAGATDDAGFGFEAVGLAVICAEPMPARQTEFASAEYGDRAESCAALIDALRQRLGPASVRQFEPVESHIPERAEVLTAVNGEGFQFPPLSGEDSAPRPLLLLPQAEQTEVTALVPEGPPRRFCWRGVTYEVAGAQGPERIGAEWWRSHQREPEPTRDYYVVEDSSGHRFWLFREGLYGRETTAARWFVHGLFA